MVRELSLHRRPSFVGLRSAELGKTPERGARGRRQDERASIRFCRRNLHAAVRCEAADSKREEHLPVHHPPGAVGRSSAMLHHRAGGTYAQAAVARRHHALGDVDPGFMHRLAAPTTRPRPVTLGLFWALNGSYPVPNHATGSTGLGREESLDLSPTSRHSVSPPATGLVAR